jgi:hypothetical protein
MRASLICQAFSLRARPEGDLSAIFRQKYGAVSISHRPSMVIPKEMGHGAVAEKMARARTVAR